MNRSWNVYFHEINEVKLTEHYIAPVRQENISQGIRHLGLLWGAGTKESHLGIIFNFHILCLLGLTCISLSFGLSNWPFLSGKISYIYCSSKQWFLKFVKLVRNTNSWSCLSPTESENFQWDSAVCFISSSEVLIYIKTSESLP